MSRWRRTNGVTLEKVAGNVFVAVISTRRFVLSQPFKCVMFVARVRFTPGMFVGILIVKSSSCSGVVWAWQRQPRKLIQTATRMQSRAMRPNNTLKVGTWIFMVHSKTSAMFTNKLPSDFVSSERGNLGADDQIDA